MAVHPLRPATRRRLGRPLPHQQADRPRAHPTPQKLSTMTPTPWSYVVLDPVSQAYPTVRGRSPTCYSPVRHSSTHHQKVVGLSVRLACVKHAASVRPEPGSNSPTTTHTAHTAQKCVLCTKQNKNKIINSVSSVYLLTRATHPYHHRRGVRHPHNNTSSVWVCVVLGTLLSSHTTKKISIHQPPG